LAGLTKRDLAALIAASGRRSQARDHLLTASLIGGLRGGCSVRRNFTPAMPRRGIALWRCGIREKGP
jgi:hypothetical protein